MYAKGCDTKTIAREFTVSVKTIESHRYNMLRKSGTHNIVTLVLAALRQETIQLSDLPEIPFEIHVKVA